MTFDARSAATEGNRRPSRLLAAYAKAAERSRQEALAAAAVRQPTVPAQPPVRRVDPRPQPGRSRPRANRVGAGRVRWIGGLAVCAVVIGVWQLSAPPRSEVDVEISRDLVAPAAPRVVENAATEPRRLVSEPAAVPVVRTPLAANIAAPVERASAPAPRPDPGARRRSSTEPPVAAPAPNAGVDQWVSPRLSKLGVRRGWRGAAIGISDPALIKDLQQGLAQLWVNQSVSNRDAIFLGIQEDGDLAKIAALRPALKNGGVMWVLYSPGDESTAAAILDRAHTAHLAPSRRITLSQIHAAMSFIAGSQPE